MQSTTLSAGFDRHAVDAGVVPPRGQLVVSTGIRFGLPANIAGFIWPRSGLALRGYFDTRARVIDSDYTGEVIVLVFNDSETEFPGTPASKITQIAFQYRP